MCKLIHIYNGNIWFVDIKIYIAFLFFKIKHSIITNIFVVSKIYINLPYIFFILYRYINTILHIIFVV